MNPHLRRLLEVTGCPLLFLGTALASLVLLTTWQLYSRYPTLEHGVFVCFALSHAYGAATLLLSSLIPLRVVYQQFDILEMLHRSRYLIFDCLCLPCLLWLLAEMVHRHRSELLPVGVLPAVFDDPWRSATIGVLSLLHVAISGPAAMDCSKYPMTHVNCLGVLYWRPARFTSRMQRPFLLVTRALWIVAICRCVMQRHTWLLAAAAAFRLAFHGHMSQWRYWPWEIFVQPLATACVCGALLHAADVAVQCDWRHLDVTRCLVVSPSGAVPLFGNTARLRF